ncbi:MAG: glycoside hydrolase family 2 sugar binding protein [Cellvibrio sp.]|nr:glycoside hydrolase family 2 sugar binding protein [Cellvibrio sp.]
MTIAATKSFFTTGALLIFLAFPLTVQAEVFNFDADWLFHPGDLEGGEQPLKDDSVWEKVNLPHDWAINGGFDEHAPATGSGAFLPTGVAWYRKHFNISEADQAKRIYIEFDGVMERSGVWINGVHIGHKPNGYISFHYDLTPHLKPEANLLSVRADTSAQPASRWYAGGGIYRHVRLITKGDIHVEAWGSYIHTPKVDQKLASVQLESSVINKSRVDRKVHLAVSILDPKGKEVAKSASEAILLQAGRSAKLKTESRITIPHLWNTFDPALHKAVVRIVADNKELLDEDEVTFGIRKIEFRADTGFWLNDKNIKLKGAAIHADGGAFGMAVPLSFYERRLEGLRALGVNAIRTAHHPFSPEFLDLCDRMGFLVMNEAFDMWTVAKNPNDYSLFFTDWSSMDAKDFVRRDRNHPSVVIWSIGNEIHDTPYPLVAKSIVARLTGIFHAEDPSREVTMALFRPNTTGDYENGLADMLDVVGQNYRENELIKAHQDKPSRKIIGTENSKNRASWIAVRDNPAFAGMFLWTGADYLGEADRAGWPFISNPAGLVDRTDVVKAIGWERASWWSDKPVIKIARRVTEVIDTSELPTMVGVAMPQPKGPGALNDWTPENQNSHLEKVEVNTNAEEAELFLNGKSLGKKPRNKDDSAITWDVNYEKGSIKAVAYSDGKIVSSDELLTAGKPAAIKLIAEQTRLIPGFDNVGFVRVEIVDNNGVLVPGANNLLKVSVEGAGSLVALDNGNPTDHTVFASKTRNAWQGRVLAMVRATQRKGNIRITVTADGLKTASTDLVATEK